MNISEMKKTQAPSPASTINHYFSQHKAQLLAALPKHMTPDRMARLAMTAFSQSLELQKCDPKSIFASVIVASQLGLEPGVNGHGYLIPYGKTCTFIPGWRGLVDLVSRSGRATVWTGAVFRGDHFEFQLGTDQFIKHVPCGEDDVNLLTHVYAVGKVNGAELPVIEVWPMSKVIRHRDRHNKVGQKHYSFKYLEMYARKVCLLQVLKYMPMSIELSSAIAVQNNAEDGKATDYINGEFVTLDDTQETDAPTEQPAQQEVQL